MIKKLTKEERELVTAAVNLMYLGAKNVMRLPGDLESKTITFSLPEHLVDEAVRQFVNDTKRVLCIGGFSYIEDSHTAEERRAFEKKQIHLSQLGDQASVEMLQRANIYLISPHCSWGTVQSTLGRVLARVHSVIPEFAVIRPIRSRRTELYPPKYPSDSVIDGLFGDFWWTPPPDQPAADNKD